MTRTTHNYEVRRRQPLPRQRLNRLCVGGCNVSSSVDVMSVRCVRVRLSSEDQLQLFKVGKMATNINSQIYKFSETEKTNARRLSYPCAINS